jgi:two-component system sensor histidine kinase YesM
MSAASSPRKILSIRRSLFLYGFIPMFFAVLLFSLILLVMTTRLMQQREESELINNTRVISGLLDEELRKIKRVSLNLAYSRRLKEAVRGYESLKREDADPSELYYATRGIQTILDETVGPLKQVPQVNILLPDGDMVCFGRYNLNQRLPDHLSSRLKRLLRQGRTSWWSAPERDYLAEKIDPEMRNYISHYQVLYDPFRNPLGYIEVKQESDALFARLQTPGENFKVFNSQNLQLYPRTLPYGSSYAVLSSRLLPYRIFSNHSAGNDERAVLCMGIATETAWKVLTVKNKDLYMAPVIRIQRFLIPLSLLIGFLGYLISSRLGRGISTPLSKLNRKLNQFQISGDPGESRPDSTGFRELDALELSFSEMNRKMDEKLDIFVAEKTLEVNARMLALQSQMDPHFLFNMLSIIDIMAEDGQTDDIQKVIRHLSTLLRYVSTLQETTVTLATELTMAEHYMRCISYRFHDTVRFTMTLPEGAEDLHIPKYSIIPLLENAVKYGMPSRPPCLIHLKIEAGEEDWVVRVEDNGPGFTKETLSALLHRIRSGIADPQMQLESHINGMGLFNICARYAMVYGKDFLFEAENRDEGGARISLGGKQSV